MYGQYNSQNNRLNTNNSNFKVANTMSRRSSRLETKQEKRYIKPKQAPTMVNYLAKKYDLIKQNKTWIEMSLIDACYMFAFLNTIEMRIFDFTDLNADMNSDGIYLLGTINDHDYQIREGKLFVRGYTKKQMKDMLEIIFWLSPIALSKQLESYEQPMLPFNVEFKINPEKIKFLRKIYNREINFFKIQVSNWRNYMIFTLSSLSHIFVIADPYYQQLIIKLLTCYLIESNTPIFIRLIEDEFRNLKQILTKQRESNENKNETSLDVQTFQTSCT